MRIAMIGHKYIGNMRDSSRGGIEVVVEEISSRMAELGHDVTCYNRDGKHGNEKRSFEYKGVKI